MEDVRFIPCPTCGAPIKIEEGERELLCTNCHHRCLLSDNQKYAIDKELFYAGENEKIPVADKRDLPVSFCNALIKFANCFLGLRRWTKISLVSAVIVAIAAIFVIKYLTRPEPIENSMAYEDISNLWTEFRNKNPYNTQIVGIKHYSDSSFNIIISEPSEMVTQKKLSKFVKRYNHLGLICRTGIGIDGWLKDAILCFNDIKDFNKFTSKLFVLLYGTDYKATYTDLSQMPSHVDFAEDNLNLQISAEELRAWFVEGDESFHDINNNPSSFLELFNVQNGINIFFSDTPGFVVWLLPRQTLKQKEFDEYARIFALDTDLILGAISTDEFTTIIGRERCVPISVLPPMRVETMRMLAQTTESELSQSYERNHLFAGKAENEWDLAPILLSDELWHTEYGSILNITDQMLKSWSENGFINYYKFSYSHPTDWAFLDGALTDLGATELTYNWNTAGAGYIVESSAECPFDIYALNRTGSLPVSYIPGGIDEITEDNQIYQFEEKAYDFFSNLSSPELVKVAEYASLYQIFTNFSIRLEKPKSSKYNTLSTKSMDDATACILKSIRDFGESEKDSIRCFFAHVAENYKLYADSLKDNDKDQSLWLTRYSEYYSNQATIDRAITKYDSLKNVIAGFKMSNDKYIERVAHFIVNPRTIDYGFIGLCDYYLDYPGEFINEYGGPEPGSYDASHPREFVEKNILSKMSYDERAMLDAFHIIESTQEFQSYNNILGLWNMEDVLGQYVSDNLDVSNQWIKCPTIVCSFSQYGGTGGHNLNSQITPVKVDGTLAKGQFKVETIKGKKVLSVSPLDKGRITPSLLRQIERTNISGIKSFATEANAVRPRKLVFANAENRSARGFNAADHVKVSRETMGFKVNDVSVNSIDELFVELRAQIANGEKLSGKSIIFENFNEGKVRLIMDGMENSQLLSKGLGTKIQLSGYDLNHITYDMSKAEQGITIVRVPIQPKAIVSSDGTIMAIKGNSIFKRVEHVFEIPTKYVKQFIARLKVFVKEGNFWNDFLFKQDLKRNDIDATEIREIYNYMVAQVQTMKYNMRNDNFFEEKTA